MKRKIIPHLWFDKEAAEAAEFYTSVFDNSKINFKIKILDTPSGDCDIVGFRIMGYDFMAMSAGPLFKINPSISFHAKCRTVEEVDELWEKLSDGGIVRMALGAYPFSKRYCWIEDKYGVSWQVVPTILSAMLSDADPKKSQQVMKAMLQMKKIDINGLKQAYER